MKIHFLIFIKTNLINNQQTLLMVLPIVRAVVFQTDNYDTYWHFWICTFTFEILQSQILDLFLLGRQWQLNKFLTSVLCFVRPNENEKKWKNQSQNKGQSSNGWCVFYWGEDSLKASCELDILIMFRQITCILVLESCLLLTIRIKISTSLIFWICNSFGLWILMGLRRGN